MGFFNDIKSLFKVDPAGRYLAFVIKAVADQNKDFLPTLLGINKKLKLTCTTEYFFPGGDRRADLAIYEDGNDDPMYLVEVKVRDNKDNDHTRGQFVDYQNCVSAGNVLKVFVISPFGLPDTQLQSIKDSKKSLELIDLSVVASELSSESELVQLFVEYLKDAGYIMKNIDNSRASAFTHFLISAFLPHRHGLGGEVKNSAERVSEGPLVFTDIVSNFQLLVQTFPSKPKKPTVQYQFIQALKATIIQKNDDDSTKYIFKVKGDEEITKKFIPSRKNKAGGKLLIYAECPLVDGIYLSVGIWIQIDNEKNNNEAVLNPVTYGTYVEVCKGSENIAYVQADLTVHNLEFPMILSSQHEAIKEFKKLAKKLVAELKKNKPELVSNVQERLPSEWLS